MTPSPFDAERVTNAPEEPAARDRRLKAKYEAELAARQEASAQRYFAAIMERARGHGPVRVTLGPEVAALMHRMAEHYVKSGVLPRVDVRDATEQFIFDMTMYQHNTPYVPERLARLQDEAEAIWCEQHPTECD